jgi:two-component system response regulator QseB
VKILLLEDHPDLRGMVAGHLVDRGFKVDAIGTLEDARAALSIATYDLALLDLGLPDGDGRELLCEMSTLTANATATIVMTAQDSLQERLECLNKGADDYLPKPFSLQELEARLRAVLRRPRAPRPYLTCGTMAYDSLSRDVSIRGISIDVTHREVDLLDALLRAAGRPVTRAFLNDRLYGFNEPVSENALEAVVSRLRHRLQTADADVRLETERGLGYRLVAGPEIAAIERP